MINLKLRQVEAADINFIYSTMLKGLYYGSEYYANVAKATFFHHYGEIITALLNKSEVAVACLPDDDDIVLGYAIYEPEVCLHYVFVKEVFRKQGVATALTGKANTSSVSHITKIGNSIRKAKDMEFNPFLAGHSQAFMVE